MAQEPLLTEVSTGGDAGGGKERRCPQAGPPAPAKTWLMDMEPQQEAPRGPGSSLQPRVPRSRRSWGSAVRGEGTALEQRRHRGPGTGGRRRRERAAVRRRRKPSRAGETHVPHPGTVIPKEGQEGGGCEMAGVRPAVLPPSIEGCAWREAGLRLFSGAGRRPPWRVPGGRACPAARAARTNRPTALR